VASAKARGHRISVGSVLQPRRGLGAHYPYCMTNPSEAPPGLEIIMHRFRWLRAFALATG
jgi:hypothetical protein